MGGTGVDVGGGGEVGVGGRGVAVGGIGVAVGYGGGVDVGGNGVHVGGFGVAVGGCGVADGGTGVEVGFGGGVYMGVHVGYGGVFGVGDSVGSGDVAPGSVGVAYGVATDVGVATPGRYVAVGVGLVADGDGVADGVGWPNTTDDPDAPGVVLPWNSDSDESEDVPFAVEPVEDAGNPPSALISLHVSWTSVSCRCTQGEPELSAGSPGVGSPFGSILATCPSLTLMAEFSPRSSTVPSATDTTVAWYCVTSTEKDVPTTVTDAEDVSISNQEFSGS